MEKLVSDGSVNQFKAAKELLGDLDTEAAAELITTAADVALILDRDGVIRDLAFGSEDLAAEDYEPWVDQPWIETVTKESRPKVEALLGEAAAHQTPKWREINHPTKHGGDVPLRYSAIEIGKDGSFVAIGRDLRPVEALQQRLLHAQQSMERDYARLRQAETRYRILFQLSSEAILIVDGNSEKVAEANPAAGSLLNIKTSEIVGKPIANAIDAKDRADMQSLLASVKAGAREKSARLAPAGGGPSFRIFASAFREDRASLFLLRLVPENGAAARPAEESRSKVLDIVETMPDGFVVTSEDLRIIETNSAFLELAELASGDEAMGEPLNRFLGRPGADVNVLLANLREHGTLRRFGTMLRGQYGAAQDVEISAVAVPNGDRTWYGFSIRTVAARINAVPFIEPGLPRSVEQLTTLVGRVSMKEIVSETTDMIERLCIEAALELTGDNRASAAEILGLSRQSLYSKLRRYGLGNLERESER